MSSLFLFRNDMSVNHAHEIRVWILDMVLRVMFANMKRILFHHTHQSLLMKMLTTTVSGNGLVESDSRIIDCCQEGKGNPSRRHIDLESHRRDLQLEVRRERYSRSKLLFQNLQILFKVYFDQGFEGLRLSSFARVLGFIKVRFSFVSGFKKSDYLEYKVYQGFRIEVERSKL
ncbi:hypothetical protein Tco_0649105 [Tanacetum coccineum]